MGSRRGIANSQRHAIDPHVTLDIRLQFYELAALRAARYASVCKGSWLSIALGLAMMVLDVRKNLKPTQL